MAQAKFQDLILRGAKVDGQLSLTGATVAGQLDMDSLRVGQELRMGAGATFEGPVSLTFARIGTNLDLRRTTFTDLGLHAARIDGELWLDTSLPSAPPERARPPVRLNLRNAHAGGLQVDWDDETKGWPGELELEGFTYDRLGGLVAAGDDASSRGMLGRDISWYTDPKVGWLARDPSYSPQPYVQLAAAFRKAGEAEKADQVLYADRERARRV